MWRWKEKEGWETELIDTHASIHQPVMDIRTGLWAPAPGDGDRWQAPTGVFAKGVSRSDLTGESPRGSRGRREESCLLVKPSFGCGCRESLLSPWPAQATGSQRHKGCSPPSLPPCPGDGPRQRCKQQWLIITFSGHCACERVPALS